jgi:thiamine pyrophosphate-dependent acetolactate synthase large subunit-like protein
MSQSSLLANLLDRRAVVSTMLRDSKGMVADGGLGATTTDMAAAGDHDRNLYLWGAMGGAVMMGLGLALAQPDVPVVVITGDGEMLMGIGSLATVGMQKPGNLSIVVLDNERYGETGGQTSHTSVAADLVGVAKACGIADSQAITTMADVEGLVPKLHELKSGPRFANIKIDGGNVDRILPMRDGTFIVNRIRGSLGFPPI